jgi:hypothetical protein
MEKQFRGKEFERIQISLILAALVFISKIPASSNTLGP